MLRRLMLLTAVAALGCGELADPGGGGSSQLPSGSNGYDTAEDLMAAAPPAWRPAGSAVTLGGASFIPPQGWEVTSYTDGVAARSPKDGSDKQCEIFVLAPRPAASGDARYQQLLDAAQTLFPSGTELNDASGTSDATASRWRGETGRGWSYVGLKLETGEQTIDVLPFLADFSGTAVPVVVIEPRSVAVDCISSTGDFGLPVATVFHSLTLDDSSAAASTLPEKVVGQWFSSDGTTGSLYVFGANGQYVDASAYGGTVEVTPGEWRDEYATWSGDGNYALRGDVMGMFPKDGDPQSRFVRHLEWLDTQGVWNRTLCWIAAYESNPYTHCLAYQAE